MNQKRQQAICKIILPLQQEREAFMTGAKGCIEACKAIMFGSLTRQMQSRGLLESQFQYYYKGFNVSGLTKSVQSISAPKWRTAYSMDPGHHECPHSSLSFLKWFKQYSGRS